MKKIIKVAFPIVCVLIVIIAFWMILDIRNKVDENCPLVEVPTPHGRLIDADAMAEDLNFDVECDQRALDQMDFVGQERENIQFDKDCKQNCMLYLSEAPTVIEAEEG